DASGYFTVTTSGLPDGAYNWRVKGPQFLANAGSLTLADGTTNAEIGLMLTGDANDDNLVSLSDFNILANTFGRRSIDPGFDGRADFNGDEVITISDFNLLKNNYGRLGADPNVPTAD